MTTVERVTDAGTLASIAGRLCREPAPLDQIFAVLDGWRAAVVSDPGCEPITGRVFLNLWWRSQTLQTILEREFGSDYEPGAWLDRQGARMKMLPVGLVGHWPAANVDIQPLLSFTCALIGGNASLVRVPSDLVDPLAPVLAALETVPGAELITSRAAFIHFPSNDTDMNEAMARQVDGAMIWGGHEATAAIRALPFPVQARQAVFGPRISVAAFAKDAWTTDKDASVWAKRLARDMWQFEQHACSSPQALFVERGAGDPATLIDSLAAAFDEEAAAHRRIDLPPFAASEIARVRASWLLNGADRSARFPSNPDWTLLIGEGHDIPADITGWRVLHVLFVDDLLEPLSRLDPSVQTLGLAIRDAGREVRLADEAVVHGVDRVVKLGSMHLFDSPWDGYQLVAPMVRIARHIVAA
ncbi:MAG: hypothetical protein MJE12_23645 [Alphaproteobacteria bacterium]|nr:hypothetical protein [Alphaproteobacteria bacterium]